MGLGVYVTDSDYTGQHINAVEAWLDAIIGTEYERFDDEDETGQTFGVTVFDVNDKEMGILRAFELQFRKDLTKTHKKDYL